jgi:hypothetical protein
VAALCTGGGQGAANSLQRRLISDGAGVGGAGLLFMLFIDPSVAEGEIVPILETSTDLGPSTQGSKQKLVNREDFTVPCKQG